MEDKIVYPCESSNIAYWTRKWGVSHAELNEAILQMGSLRAKELKEYLKRKKFAFTFPGMLQFIKLHF